MEETAGNLDEPTVLPEGSGNATKSSDLVKEPRHPPSLQKILNAMLFQLFGNKPLVETLIRIPICGAAQPATVLSHFATAWYNYDNSAEALQARHNSLKREEPQHKRCSQQIHELRTKTQRGQSIAEWVAEDANNWYRLSREDKDLMAEYESGKMVPKLAELKAQQQAHGPNFRGAAECMVMQAKAPASSVMRFS